MATQITLVHNGKAQSFDIDHAERLLQYQQARNLNHWQLPPKSEYKYHNGKISFRSARAAAQSAAKGAAK